PAPLARQPELSAAAPLANAPGDAEVRQPTQLLRRRRLPAADVPVGASGPTGPRVAEGDPGIADRPGQLPDLGGLSGGGGLRLSRVHPGGACRVRATVPARPDAPAVRHPADGLEQQAALGPHLRIRGPEPAPASQLRNASYVANLPR